MRSIETSTVKAVFEDWRSAPIREPLRAALGLLEAATQRPAQTPSAELAACRAVGLDDEAIEDAASIGFQFNFINRIADALDFPHPNERQLARVAKLLDSVPSVFGKPPEPSWVLVADGIARPVGVEDGRTRMSTLPGATSPALRRAAEAYVMRTLGGQRASSADDPELPAALHGYLGKLARHAYRIVDDDVEALRADGHDDEAIFELTMVGACAAALVGLESTLRGLLLDGAKSESKRESGPELQPTR